MPPITLTKVSILLFYRRLFLGYETFRVICLIVMIQVIIGGIIFPLLAIFGCAPIAASWDRASYPDAVCLNGMTVGIAGGFFNCITDFIVVLLPSKFLYSVPLPKRQKAAVGCVFGLGIL